MLLLQIQDNHRSSCYSIIVLRGLIDGEHWLSAESHMCFHIWNVLYCIAFSMSEISSLLSLHFCSAVQVPVTRSTRMPSLSRGLYFEQESQEAPDGVVLKTCTFSKVETCDNSESICLSQDHIVAHESPQLKHEYVDTRVVNERISAGMYLFIIILYLYFHILYIVFCTSLSKGPIRSSIPWPQTPERATFVCASGSTRSISPSTLK